MFTAGNMRHIRIVMMATTTRTSTREKPLRLVCERIVCERTIMGRSLPRDRALCPDLLPIRAEAVDQVATPAPGSSWIMTAAGNGSAGPRRRAPSDRRSPGIEGVGLHLQLADDEPRR